MEEENQVEVIVDDIISQLKDTTSLTKKVTKMPEDDVSRDNLESFVIKSASTLVKQSLDLVNDAQANAAASGGAEDVEALAALVKSATSAIESLSRLSISNERNKTQKEIKTMDVESKLIRNTQDNTTKIMMSHKDVIDALLDDSKKKDGVKTIDI